MPINKNANIRYQTLDRCFRDVRRRYFIADLIRECSDALRSYNFEGGVSRRQILFDINFMESDAGYAIELERLREGKRVYYRYADPTFSINQQPLSQAEAAQLQQAVTTLTRFRGLPHYEWIEEVITSLEHRFNFDSHGKSLVCFEQNTMLKGLEHLGSLIEAATARRVLKINYHTYKNGGRDIDFIIHPYYLKQYNGRWFLFGRNDATGQISNLALDRIVKLEQIPDMQFIDTDIDFDHHFDNVVGVTIPADITVRTITFRTTERQFPYIVSKPLHPSQRVVNRRQCLLSIDVAPNIELEHRLLSYGPDIEVVAPDDFRKQMKKKIEESYKNYFPVQEDCTNSD